MKNYKLNINVNKEIGTYCEVPFISVNDKGKYSLIFQNTEGKYSAVDLESGHQINAVHSNLNGLFRNFPSTLGNAVEAGINVIKN